MAWYFLRMPGCDCPATLALFGRRVATIGRIWSSKIGTAVDATAAWFVVRSPAADVPELRRELRIYELSDAVDMVEPLQRPVDGAALARQLSLF